MGMAKSSLASKMMRLQLRQVGWLRPIKAERSVHRLVTSLVIARLLAVLTTLLLCFASAAMPVTLADVFDVEAAEAPYQRLVAALNRQEALLERLNARLDNLGRQQEATSRAVDRLESDKLFSLQNQVAEVKSSAERDRQELWRECNEQIERLEAVVGEKSDRNELLDAAGRAESATIKLGLEIRAETASFELVNSLQASQSLLHDRLETMDRRLEGKVDKTDAARMNATLTQIREFRPVAAQLTARVDELETNSALAKKNIDESRRLLEKHSSELLRLDSFANETNDRASAVEQELLHTVTPHIRSIHDQIAGFNASATKWAALTDRLDGELGSLSAQLHKQVMSSTDSERHIRANIETVQSDLAVLQDRSNGTWRKISKSLAERAKAEVVQVLNEQVQRLDQQCEALERHAEVSARFLDWFASRGEAHEHNMRVVETQLGRITVGSDPRRREPFGGNVRFPRSN